MGLFVKLLFAVCLFALPEIGRAEDAMTKDEAISMVRHVENMFQVEGAEATFAAVTAQHFKDRDLYPFIFDFTGLCLAHGATPKMVGKMWANTRDQDGNYLILNMVKVAQESGSGWVTFKWPHPQTHKIMDKSAFVQRLDDRHFVGVGVYLQ